MIRPSLRFAALGAASLLVSVPAFAQLGSVTYTPPSAPPPPSAPSAPAMPTAGEAVAVPVGQAAAAPAAQAAPMALAPKVAEDMGGSVGFGLGVIPGNTLVTTDKVVSVKVWTSDSMAIVPSLNFMYSKPKDVDATWNLAPEVVLLFVPWKTTSTRFELGGGIGFGVGKAAPMVVGTTTDTAFEIHLPVQAGVEHFFAHWFSMGIAARMNLFDFNKIGDAQTVSFNINSTALLGQVFFYTD